MSAIHETISAPASALVAKAAAHAGDADGYLLITPAGSAAWVDDPAEATAFASMREAARVALRLPAGLRAFGLPRRSELALRDLH